MQELQPVSGMAGRPASNGGSSATAQHGAAEVRCPRCGSPNTKFCYYNNYNLAQPRHFCKACRRYWTKGGHLRNVPVGGGCRKHKPMRPAAAAVDRDGSDRNGKIPRSGCASSSPVADGDAPVSSAFSVVTEPSGINSGPSSSVAEAGAGTDSCAAGDTRALLVPPQALVFADQAAAFASLFATPRPLPAFSSSAHPMAEERVASSLAEQPSPESDAAAAGTAPFSGSARPEGALAAGASDWPTAASGAGLFELAGGIAGDASLPEYWNAGSWTDPDPAIYLP